jgi:hypothetical protein
METNEIIANSFHFLLRFVHLTVHCIWMSFLSCSISFLFVQTPISVTTILTQEFVEFLVPTAYSTPISVRRRLCVSFEFFYLVHHSIPSLSYFNFIDSDSDSDSDSDFDFDFVPPSILHITTKPIIYDIDIFILIKMQENNKLL